MADHLTVQTYVVPGMSCSHCATAVAEEVDRIEGVESVKVALDTNRVTVRGREIDDRAVRAAIRAAGYEAAT